MSKAAELQSESYSQLPGNFSKASKYNNSPLKDAKKKIKEPESSYSIQHAFTASGDTAVNQSPPSNCKSPSKAGTKRKKEPKSSYTSIQLAFTASGDTTLNQSVTSSNCNELTIPSKKPRHLPQKTNTVRRKDPNRCNELVTPSKKLKNTSKNSNHVRKETSTPAKFKESRNTPPITNYFKRKEPNGSTCNSTQQTSDITSGVNPLSQSKPSEFREPIIPNKKQRNSPQKTNKAAKIPTCDTTSGDKTSTSSLPSARRKVVKDSTCYTRQTSKAKSTESITPKKTTSTKYQDNTFDQIILDIKKSKEERNRKKVLNEELQCLISPKGSPPKKNVRIKSPLKYRNEELITSNQKCHGLEIIDPDKHLCYYSTIREVEEICSALKMDDSSLSFEKFVYCFPPELIPLTSENFCRMSDERLVQFLFRVILISQVDSIILSSRDALLHLITSTLDHSPQPWVPSLCDIVSVLLNYGCRIEKHCPLRDIFIAAKAQFCEKKQFDGSSTEHPLQFAFRHRKVLDLLNLSALLDLVTELVNLNLYSDHDLSQLILLFSWLALDPQTDSILRAIRNCVTSSLQVITNLGWNRQWFVQLTAQFNILTGTPESLLRIVHLFYPTSRSLMLRKALSYCAVHLCFNAPWTFKKNIKPEDIKNLLSCYPLTDLLKECTTVMLALTHIDYCIGNCVVTNSDRRYLKKLVDLFKLHSGKIVDNILTPEVTKVKNFMIILSCKWSMMLQGFESSHYIFQEGIFEKKNSALALNGCLGKSLSSYSNLDDSSTQSIDSLPSPKRFISSTNASRAAESLTRSPRRMANFILHDESTVVTNGILPSETVERPVIKSQRRVNFQDSVTPDTNCGTLNNTKNGIPFSEAVERPLIKSQRKANFHDRIKPDANPGTLNITNGIVSSEAVEGPVIKSQRRANFPDRIIPDANLVNVTDGVLTSKALARPVMKSPRKLGNFLDKIIPDTSPVALKVTNSNLSASDAGSGEQKDLSEILTRRAVIYVERVFRHHSPLTQNGTNSISTTSQGASTEIKKEETDLEIGRVWSPRSRHKKILNDSAPLFDENDDTVNTTPGGSLSVKKRKAINQTHRYSGATNSKTEVALATNPVKKETQKVVLPDFDDESPVPWSSRKNFKNPQDLLKPFKHGWQRSLVTRSDKQSLDVYYHAPGRNKSIRSMRDVDMYLAITNPSRLSHCNFSFQKVPIFHPPAEICRQASKIKHVTPLGKLSTFQELL